MGAVKKMAMQDDSGAVDIPTTYGISEKQRDKLIKRACDLTNEQKKIEQELKGLKEYFCGMLDRCQINRILTKAGGVECVVSNSYKIDPINYQKMVEIFGKETPEYVTIKTEFGITSKCRKLLSDGGFEYSKKLRDAVDITSRVSVKFTPLSN